MEIKFQKFKFIIILIISFVPTLCEPPANIVVGVQNKILTINSDCQQFQILTNYKHINFNISNIKNIDKILISDKPLSDCNFKECQADANICQIRSVNKKSQINFDSKMCIGAVYINFKKAYNSEPEENGETKFSFEISSNYILGGSCEYIHENAFAYCGESNLEECRTCKRPGCTVIQCGNEISTGKNGLEKFVKLYDLCVPYDVSGEEKYKKCLKFYNVTTYRPSGECEYDSLEGYSSLTIFLIGIIVIIVLVFSIAVIYYNVYLIKYQSTPFSVPSFMPEFLFPRSGNQRTRTTMDNRLDDVFSGENRQNF